MMRRTAGALGACTSWGYDSAGQPICTESASDTPPRLVYDDSDVAPSFQLGVKAGAALSRPGDASFEIDWTATLHADFQLTLPGDTVALGVSAQLPIYNIPAPGSAGFSCTGIVGAAMLVVGLDPRFALRATGGSGYAVVFDQPHLAGHGNGAPLAYGAAGFDVIVARDTDRDWALRFEVHYFYVLPTMLAGAARDLMVVALTGQVVIGVF